jgi:hypothetical protein
MNVTRRGVLTAAALAAPGVVFLIAYAPAVGHGFIADDFRWVVENRVATPRDIVGIFSRNIGFYRPLVALTFAADSFLFGDHPMGFGWTNLLLAVACGVLALGLIRALGLPTPAAALGSSLWLLDYHGTHTAILWTSGRTALVLVAASLATAIALLRGRALLALVGLLLALFAKEEATVLPLILLAFLVVLRRSTLRRPRIHPALWLALSCAALTVYALMRARSGSMTPGGAPPYYRFTLAPARAWENALHYAEAALTLPAATCLVAFVLLRPFCGPIRLSRARVACGLLWLVGGFAPTLLLEVRSTLYACFPSIGAAIVAAEVCAGLWSGATPRSRGRAVVVAIALPLALLPVYRALNHRWVDLADYSSSVLEQLPPQTARIPDNSRLVLLDEDRAQRVNLESAFGTLMNDAFLLRTGRRLDFWIEPPLAKAGLAGLAPPCPSCVALRLRVKSGRVAPLD